jgi:hypothetical protein
MQAYVFTEEICNGGYKIYAILCTAIHTIYPRHVCILERAIGMQADREGR